MAWLGIVIYGGISWWIGVSAPMNTREEVDWYLTKLQYTITGEPCRDIVN
jgi:hypothetical protein